MPEPDGPHRATASPSAIAHVDFLERRHLEAVVAVGDREVAAVSQLRRRHRDRAHRTTAPSRSSMTRCAALATACECVTTTTAQPCSIGQAAQRFEHDALVRGVELPGRLVGEDERSLARHRRGDRHPLLLAARERGDPMVGARSPGRRPLARHRPAPEPDRSRRAAATVRCSRGRSAWAGDSRSGRRCRSWRCGSSPAPARSASPGSRRMPARRPAEGRSSPAAKASRVLLPQPEGPRIATIWPLRTSRSTPRSATVSTGPER